MLRLTFYALWIAPAIIFVCLAVLMVRRGTRRDFPFFFTYAVYQVLAFGVQFYMYHRQSQALYFYAYWTMAALSIGIAVAVLHEVFVELFRPFAGLRDFGSVLFRWAGVVLVTSAVLMAMSSPPTSSTNRGFIIVVSLERGVRAMQCGMVLLMILCAPRLGLRYRQRVFGIALGFGIIAAMDLIGMTVVARIGLSASTFYNLMRMGAFNFAALLWTGYFLAPEPARLPAQQLAHTDRWDFAMATITSSDTCAPALPMIVDAVERVWRKSNGHGVPRHADQ